MKMDQNTTQTSTALLRNSTGVDTLETNSLCCAAAGIIAPLRATAEALIPHEKLRGAATPDATLIARSCPLAQPDVGCKPLMTFCIDLQERFLQTANVGRNIVFYNIQKVFKNDSSIDVTYIDRANRSEKIQDDQSQIVGVFQQKVVKPARLQSAQPLENVLHASLNELSIRTKPIRVNPICFRKQMHNFMYKTPQLKTVSNLPLILLRFSSTRFTPSLPCWNSSRSQDRPNRSNRLNPGGSVFFNLERIQHNKQCPAHCTCRQKGPSHPHTSDLHRRRHTKPLHASWLLAIKKSRACPYSSYSSMKEAA